MRQTPRSLLFSLYPTVHPRGTLLLPTPLRQTILLRTVQLKPRDFSARFIQGSTRGSALTPYGCGGSCQLQEDREMASNPPNHPPAKTSVATPPALSPAGSQVGSSSGFDGAQRRSGGSGSFGAGATSRNAGGQPRNKQASRTSHKHSRRFRLADEDAIAESVSGPSFVPGSVRSAQRVSPSAYFSPVDGKLMEHRRQPWVRPRVGRVRPRSPTS